MTINQYPIPSSFNRSTVVVSPVGSTFTVDCLAGTDFYLDLSLPTYSTLNRQAPVFVGRNSSGFAGSTSATRSVSLTALTGGVDTTARANDLVIVAFAVGSTTDRDLSLNTAGYTEITDIYIDTSNPVDGNLAVFYKVMGSTPDTTVVSNPTGSANDGGAMVVHVFRNVDLTNIFAGTTTSTTTQGITSPNPPAITTTVGDSVVMAISGVFDANTTNLSSTQLSGFTTVSGSDTNSATLGAGFLTTATVGSVDPTSITGTLLSDSSISVTLALRGSLIDSPPVTINFTNISDSYKQVYVYADAKQRSDIINGYSTSFSGVSNYSATSFVSLGRSQQEQFYFHNGSILRISPNYQKIKKTSFITSTQTWTAPFDVSEVEVLMCGGGGGGTTDRGGSGSVDRKILSVTPGASYTVTIGAGGIANDGSGSASSFGALLTVDGAQGIGQPGNMGGGGGGFDGPNLTIYFSQTDGIDGYGAGGLAGTSNTAALAGPANSGRGGSESTAGGSGVAIITYWSAL